MRIILNALGVIGLLVVTAQTGVAQGTTHELPCAPGKVHLGHYDAALKPVLTIKSGDSVRVESCLLPVHAAGALLSFGGCVHVVLVGIRTPSNPVRRWHERYSRDVIEGDL